MKFILGKKLGMTQVFKEDGTVVPVTKIKAGPCVVVQVKTIKKDGVSALQVGFGTQKIFRLNKSQRGHQKELSNDSKIGIRFLRDFFIEEGHNLKRGDVFTVEVFEPGDKVKVSGKAKGRGFQGVVKRHGFKGSPASHGHKDQLRMPGSIGATDAARVFKGTRMGGHMGDNRVTVDNLEIIEVDLENNEILLKGAVPGARNGLLMVSSEIGEIEIKKQPEKSEESKGFDKSEEPKSEELKKPKESEEEEKPVKEKEEKKDK